MKDSEIIATPKMELEVKISKDGSNTLFVPSLNEHYHSTNGAITEAIHVYRTEGLDFFHQENPLTKSINILEIGFGTGLNALVSAMSHITPAFNYDGLELLPLPIETIQQLNYTTELGANSKELYSLITQADWNKPVKITNSFTLHKINQNLLDWSPQKKYQVIYFDAFGPEVQPEMWSPEVFDKIAIAADQGAVLTTYCAKGEVRRQLKLVGFKVFRIPGPPGKREMARAVKL